MVCGLGVGLLGAATAGAQASTALSATPYVGPLRLEVDASDNARRVLRVRERVPVRPGPLTLALPRWIPGYHAPVGDVAQLAGLQIKAGDRELAWERDPLDTQRFKLVVPAGVSVLDIGFQHLVASGRSPADRVEMTGDLLDLAWNTVVLYPVAWRDTAVTVEPSLRLPAGWQAATALTPAATDATADGVLRFQPLSLEQLIDSPVYAARHLKSVPLDPPGTPQPVTLHLTGDTAALLDASDAQLQAHRTLVAQADRLFGVRHFGHYAFLLAQSDHLGEQGLEHHQSSENAVRAGYFKEWDKAIVDRNLLPHEYVHSWNGKYRRPAELATGNPNEPMRTSLLWVYEGQTQYWGHVLTSRSGLATPAQMRDVWADIAAWAEHNAGRRWRTLQDTTQQPIIDSRHGNQDWSNWQRGVDYYDESALIWLEADMLVRSRSNGARSLDDFARRFFGVQAGDRPGDVAVRPYGFDDVVQALNAVEANDWAGFLRTRLASRDAPLAGLAAAGWALAYGDAPSAEQKAREEARKVQDLSHSIGLLLDKDGQVLQVAWDGPAAEAGLSPAAKVIAVDGRAYTPDVLSDAVAATRPGKTGPDNGHAGAIDLLVRENDVFRTAHVVYGGGHRFPKLVRLEGTPDRLSEQMAPR